MRSYITSYSALFGRFADDVPAVKRIEIPLIQRDYAQGRGGGVVERIRTSFLSSLHSAVTGGPQVNLDFIYGEVEDGTFRPLDGQQRLTTLFLLHWYLSIRSERLGQLEGWKQFSYATRASARLFCERLSSSQPPTTVENFSEWIEDQSWYLHTWRHDPTVQSMLVMLDAMHECFREDDCLAAWDHLVDPEKPAILFHLLPIAQEGLSEDLYVKMNSRGKPLTPFENFKARFEQVLDASCPQRVEEFAHKVDGAWADLLWPYRGKDDIVDDRFLRYFRFITEVCEWREGRLASEDIASLAESVYGQDNPLAETNIDFFCRAMDTWVAADVKAAFGSLFAIAPASLDSVGTNKVVLFGQQGADDVDLFAACCDSYGEMRGNNRVFSWPQTMFLYAVLLHRLHKTNDFARRLRLLRNLVEASSNELRLENMPALLADVQRIVITGMLDGISTFNQAQVLEERVKVDFLEKHPGIERSLFQLEDHPVLRGCLAAFEFDETVFEQRASTFLELFADDTCLASLTGALVAVGDYSRHLNPRMFQFGSGSNVAPWRKLLAGAGRAQLTSTRDVLGRLLDAVAAADRNPRIALDTIQRTWLDATNESHGLDWRWYLVKYPVMREGRSGIYVGSNGSLGFDLCMMDKTQMNSWYRDPFLSAINRESGVADAIEQRWADGPWFTGYETEARWLCLRRSGTRLRCTKEGLALSPPGRQAPAETFALVCSRHAVDAAGWINVPQVERGDHRLDTSDRVQLGAALLRDLVESGL